MDVNDLKIFCNNIKLIIKSNGSKNKDVVSSEYSSRKNARRSIVVSKSLLKGDTFNEEKFNI